MKHRITYGASSEQKHECKICGEVFSPSKQLSDHHSTTHYTKKEGQLT